MGKEGGSVVSEPELGGEKYLLKTYTFFSYLVENRRQPDPSLGRTRIQCKC